MCRCTLEVCICLKWEVLMNVLLWTAWSPLCCANSKRCLFQAAHGRVMRGKGAQNSIMRSVLCTCAFMICIDSRAWRIGYKLGNILACKWNILNCGSVLVGVLDPQGLDDILFVCVKSLCYFLCRLWYHCFTLVIHGSFIGTRGHWKSLSSVIWACSLREQAISAFQTIILGSTTLDNLSKKYLSKWTKAPEFEQVKGRGALLRKQEVLVSWWQKMMYLLCERGELHFPELII